MMTSAITATTTNNGAAPYLILSSFVVPLSHFIKQLDAEYSFIRLEGLRSLLDFVDNLRDEETATFLTVQDDEEKNVCVLLCRHILRTPKYDKNNNNTNNGNLVTTAAATATATTSTTIAPEEIALALQVMKPLTRWQHSSTANYLLAAEAHKVRHYYDTYWQQQ
jgi:hypothetical protein